MKAFRIKIYSSICFPLFVVDLFQYCLCMFILSHFDVQFMKHQWLVGWYWYCIKRLGQVDDICFEWEEILSFHMSVTYIILLMFNGKFDPGWFHCCGYCDEYMKMRTIALMFFCMLEIRVYKLRITFGSDCSLHFLLYVFSAGFSVLSKQKPTHTLTTFYNNQPNIIAVAGCCFSQ